MIDDLRARFRDRFLESARRRLARVRAHAADSDLASIASELHAMAGESALLEYTDCAAHARAGETHARAGEARKCKDEVEALARAVDVIAG